MDRNTSERSTITWSLTMISTIRRLPAAVGTALAVVFGLKPDPSRVAVYIDDRRR